MAKADWKVGGGDRERILQELEKEPLGLKLRNKRESLGLKIEDISKSIHVKVENLQLFENNQLPEGTSMVFIRGQFLAYAKFLELD